jgi:hypothetical protein
MPMQRSSTNSSNSWKNSWSLAVKALPLLLALASPALAGELHDVTPTPAKAKVGAAGKASVTLSAKNGWKLNAEAPVSLKLTPPPGLTVDKPELSRKDLAQSDAHAARFDVGFSASEPGTKNIQCEASFVICQESACKPVKETVVLAVDVTADKPAAKPKKK